MSVWIVILIYAYLTVAGLIAKFLGPTDSPYGIVLDLIWPLTVWFKLANYYIGRTINMENYFLRK